MKWSACQERGTKKKIWVPDRIRTYDLPNTGEALYPLELRRTHRERGHILGSFLTRVLHTARISNVDVALCGERMKDCKSSFFFSWIIDSFLSFEKRPNIDLYVEYSRTLIWWVPRILSSLIRSQNFTQKMACSQLRTKTRTSISQKICYVKSGFQILYAVEQLSSQFSR